MVELEKVEKLEERTESNLYSVAKYLANLYYKKRNKMISYNRLEICLFNIWRHSIEKDSKELFTLRWKLSYDRVMPADLEIENRLRTLLSQFKPGDTDGLSRDVQNMIHAVYLDKDDLFYWKVKEVRRFALEKLGLLCLENLSIIDAAGYATAIENRKMHKKLEWSIAKKRYEKETILKYGFCALMIFIVKPILLCIIRCIGIPCSHL